jgi:hypothetical protein
MRPVQKIKKTCPICFESFLVYPNPADIKQTYCSNTCSVSFQRSHKYREKQRKIAMENNHGNYYTSGSNLGEEHHNWRGDDVSYSGIHYWVSRHLGKPSKCEHCGSTEENKYEWANISKEYKRDLTDWVRLCVSCHIKFDGYCIVPGKGKIYVGDQ